MMAMAPSSSSAASSEQTESEEPAASSAEAVVPSFSSASSSAFAAPAAAPAPASASASAVHPLDELMSEATAQFDLLYSAIKQHDANDEKYSQMVSEVSEAELRERLHAVEMVVFELGMRQSAAMRAGRDMDVMGEGMKALQRIMTARQRQQQASTELKAEDAETPQRMQEG